MSFRCSACGQTVQPVPITEENPLEELEADKKELLRTIENLEDRIRCKEKEINAANKLATQRGARMQMMREWMRGSQWDGDNPWHEFQRDYPDAADWFDADGVPVREGK